VYRIKDWTQLYEKTRKDRPAPQRLGWIPVISKLKGNGIGWLLEQDDGLAAFGLFVLLLEAAGDVPPPRDGRLVNSDNRPYELDDLRRLTSVKEPQLKKGLVLLTSDKLAWVTNDSHVTDMCQTDDSHVSSKIRSDKIRSDKNISCPNSDEFRLSRLLFDLIQERQPNVKKPNFEKWAIHIDRMIRLDKRTVSDIETVIAWCQQDDFWQTNIRSTEKLRQQFDQLQDKMRGEKETKPDPRKCKQCGSTNLTEIQGYFFCSDCKGEYV